MSGSTLHQALELLGTSLAMSAGAFLGAVLALPMTLTPRRGVTILGFAAGVLFGAAMLHMLPDAVQMGGYQVFPYALLGFVAVLLLERFVPQHHDHDGHQHAPGEQPEALGLPTFVALSLHTLTDGLALGVALQEGRQGAVVLLAVVLHQVPAAISLVSILRGEGYARARVLLMTATFALMVPVGGLLFLGLQHATDVRALTPCALAFSAGTFLHLALADLLPQVHRRAEVRRPATVALLLGLGVMWAIRLVGA